MPKQHMYDGWSYDRLRQQRNRAHFLLEDPYRFITVILLNDGRLLALDSPCYHASGPLGEGEVVEVEEAHINLNNNCNNNNNNNNNNNTRLACLRCPWHGLLISVETGEELEVLPSDINNNINNNNNNITETLPTYPLRPHWEVEGNKNKKRNGPVRVVRGRVVQRTHKVWLDESSGILTIEVEDEAEIRKRPIPSDAAAGDLKNGALTMQIFDIKARGIN